MDAMSNDDVMSNGDVMSNDARRSAYRLGAVLRGTGAASHGRYTTRVEYRLHGLHDLHDAAAVH